MAKLPFNATSLNPKDKMIYDNLVAARKNLGAPFSGPYLALMNHPELCEKIESLGRYLKFNGHLPRDVYQFIVLAVANFTGAVFEWRDHIQHAVETGVSESVIKQLKVTGIAYKNFPENYQIAADILQASLQWKNIPEPLQNRAIEFYGMQGFVEIVVLSGFYQLFAGINQGFDIT